MLLRISHETQFEYGQPVSEVYMEFRLTPVSGRSQHVLQHRAAVTPPRTVRHYVDSLGNTVSYYNIFPPVERIEITFESVVDTIPPEAQDAAGPAAGSDSQLARMELHDMLQQTGLTTGGEEFTEFVRPLADLRGGDPQTAAETIRSTIFGSFRYMGEVTSASSPITDLLREGAGVCQDFAHLMLAACRHLGFPARYVSGYVLPRVAGEAPSASHAWCEIFAGEHGWVGMDPTHDQRVDDQYVRLGVGRDYRDVPPNRGVFRGPGAEEVRVSVHLTPLVSGELESFARTLRSKSAPATFRPHQSRKTPPRSILEQTAAAQEQQQQ